MNGCPSCERDLSWPGQPGHECYTRHGNGPLADEQAASGPDTHREAWRVAWPSGTGTLWAHHDTEPEAIADAERIVAAGTKQVVIYQVTVIEGEAA